jgi:hypothetical protein
MSDDQDAGDAMNKVLFALQGLGVTKAMIILLGAMVITLAEGEPDERPSASVVLHRIEAFANLLARVAT